MITSTISTLVQQHTITFSHAQQIFW